MKKMSKVIKIVIGVVVLIAVIFLVYKVTSSEEKTPDNQVAERVDYTTAENVVATGEAAALLRTLKNLEKVELDGAIFSDPAFQILFDYSKDITPIQKYRQNPFSPIGTPNTIRRDSVITGSIETDAPAGGPQATSTTE